jgi:hypothetical protein
LLAVPAALGDDTMTDHKEKIAGTWRKTTVSECSRKYPETITFQEGKLYTGRNDEPGTFTEWDVGTYVPHGERQFKISTANDANIAYDFKLEGKTLTFTDPDGCTFSYDKVG